MVHFKSYTINRRSRIKFGAKNKLTGKVAEIKKGMLMCQAKIERDHKGTMLSVFTLDSLKELGIKKEDKVQVIVKAVNLLLAKSYNRETYNLRDLFNELLDHAITEHTSKLHV
jgi:molybdopterin-binding protein